MKELTIEQKARAYDEAIKRAKVFKEHLLEINDKGYVDEMDYIFPELKESEGDNICKNLIAFLKRCKAVYGNDFNQFDLNIDDAIAWIEKQGKQNTVVVIPKFRIGDEIKTVNEKSLTITKIDNKGYWSEDLFICDFDEECVWDLVEQKPAWSEEDEKMINKLLAVVRLYYDRDCDDLDKQSCISFLKSLKDRVQSQPKKEWSEEDEEIHRKCICAMRASACGFPEEEKFVEQVDNWLKSLRLQKQWKPSDNELEVLRLAAEKDGTCLMGLYEQLKKLKG